jgi:4-hydroxy-2-oxoheptanedioate aldolase
MTGEQARRRLEQGFDMVSVSTDTHSLVRDLSAQLAALKH